MDPQRKLELMKKYHFDGFGNRTASLLTSCYLLTLEGTTREQGEKYIGWIRDNFVQMHQRYAEIDFEGIRAEMNEPDFDDFATLFKTRDILPKLKDSIDKFVTFVRNHNYDVSKEEQVYQELSGRIDEIIQADNHKSIRYRTRIKHLENLLKESEPATKI